MSNKMGTRGGKGTRAARRLIAGSLISSFDHSFFLNCGHALVWGTSRRLCAGGRRDAPIVKGRLGGSRGSGVAGERPRSRDKCVIEKRRVLSPTDVTLSTTSRLSTVLFQSDYYCSRTLPLPVVMLPLSISTITTTTTTIPAAGATRRQLPLLSASGGLPLAKKKRTHASGVGVCLSPMFTRAIKF